MSAARPLTRTTEAVERALRLIVWGTQVSVVSAYFAVAAQPGAWRPVLAEDQAGAVIGWASVLALLVLWMGSLYAEQRRFYDRTARRAYRKIGLLAHAGIIVFPLGVAADQRQWVALCTLPVVCTFPSVVAWHAWMRSLALPPEDQAVVDAILGREAREAAAQIDASRKELRHKRLDAIIIGLGHQAAVTEASAEAKPTTGTGEPAAASRPWEIPARKHRPLVYFLRNGNRIKIGTTTELKRRIRTLALRPENVVLLLDGDQRLERELHRQFAGLRIGNSEWFAYDGPLIDFVHTKNARAAEKGEPK